MVRVIVVDLNHQFVEVLDDVFHLLFRKCQFLGDKMARVGEHTLERIVSDLTDGCHAVYWSRRWLYSCLERKTS